AAARRSRHQPATPTRRSRAGRQAPSRSPGTRGQPRGRPRTRGGSLAPFPDLRAAPAGSARPRPWVRFFLARVRSAGTRARRPPTRTDRPHPRDGGLAARCEHQQPEAVDRRRRRPRDPHRLGLPGWYDLRRDRPGPTARRLLHERARLPRLRADCDRRHAPQRSDDRRPVTDSEAALPAPERRPAPDRLGHLLVAKTPHGGGPAGPPPSGSSKLVLLAPVNAARI